jgi:hypothetical protein
MHSPSVCPYQERAPSRRPVLAARECLRRNLLWASMGAARLPKRRNFIKLRRPIRGGNDGPTRGVVQDAEGCRRVRCPLFQHARPARKKDCRPAEIRSQQRPGRHAHGAIRPSSGCHPAFRRFRRDPEGVRKPARSGRRCRRAEIRHRRRRQRLRRAGPVIPGRAFSCGPGTQRCNRQGRPDSGYAAPEHGTETSHPNAGAERRTGTAG